MLDVAIELMRRGHHPVAYSTILGPVADELRAATIPVIQAQSSAISGNHDARMTVPVTVLLGNHVAWFSLAERFGIGQTWDMDVGISQFVRIRHPRLSIHCDFGRRPTGFGKRISNELIAFVNAGFECLRVTNIGPTCVCPTDCPIFTPLMTLGSLGHTPTVHLGVGSEAVTCELIFDPLPDVILVSVEVNLQQKPPRMQMIPLKSISK